MNEITVHDWAEINDLELPHWIDRDRKIKVSPGRKEQKA